MFFCHARTVVSVARITSATRACDSVDLPGGGRPALRENRQKRFCRARLFLVDYASGTFGRGDHLERFCRAPPPARFPPLARSTPPRPAPRPESPTTQLHLQAVIHRAHGRQLQPSHVDTQAQFPGRLPSRSWSMNALRRTTNLRVMRPARVARSQAFALTRIRGGVRRLETDPTGAAQWAQRTGPPRPRRRCFRECAGQAVRAAVQPHAEPSARSVGFLREFRDELGHGLRQFLPLQALVADHALGVENVDRRVRF
jgi:hypothetical protein